MKKITFLFFFAFFSWLGHAQLPVEDFDGTGWSLGATTDWWSHQNTVSLSQAWRQSNPAVSTIEIPYDPVNPTNPAGNCAFVNQQNGPDGGDAPKDWLVTPSFLVPANGQLKFQSRLGFTGNQGGIYKILITTDVGGDLSDLTIYQDVIQWTEPLLNPNQIQYTQKIVNLPLALVGQNVRLAFYMEGDMGDRWMVDDVSVVEQCLPPTDLGISAIGTDTATLAWTGSPTDEYEVEWMLANEAPTTVPDLTVTGTSTVLSSLIPETCYKFYVRSVCGTGDFSDWTLPYTFCTPPANDECADAVALTINPTNICTVSTNGTINSATASNDGAETCAGTEDDDVWYTFVATNTIHLISLNNITGSTTDLNHILYSGSCGSLTQVACSTANNSTATGLTIGTTYTLRVYSHSATPQTTAFTVCIGTPPPPPVNDECSGAISVLTNPDLNCTSFATGSVYSATASSQASTCTGSEDDDIWFSFVATSTSHRVNLTNITGGTTAIYHTVYSGTCDAINQMYCSTLATSMAGNLTIGNTYYVRVYSAATTAQTSIFDICIGTPPPPPANDECSTATAVTVNPDLNCTSVTPGTIAWATASPEDATICGGTEDDDVWFSFVATNPTHTIGINNIVGGTSSIYHTIYSGNCGALSNILCSTSNSSYISGLTVGNTYYVRVYSFTAVTGQSSTFDICVGTPPPPGNDECSDSVMLTVNPNLNCATVTSATVEWATPSPEDATVCNGSEDDDVWFQFVATNTAHVIRLSNIQPAIAMYHAVYSGECGSLTNISCHTATSSMVSNLTIGATYTVRVYTLTAIAQSNTFDICVSTPPPAPENDECANATAVTVNPDLECGTITPGTINYATGSLEATGCFGIADDDVWFEFVATNAIHTIDLLNVSGTSLYHSVYQ